MALMAASAPSTVLRKTARRIWTLIRRERSIKTWILLFWSAFYVCFAAVKPTIVVAKRLHPDVRKLIARTRSVRSRYWPNALFMDGWMQTALARWLRPQTRFTWIDLQTVGTKDGGSFCLAWAGPAEQRTAGPRANAPVLFVLPGLVGNHRSFYLQNLIDHAVNVLGWRAVVYVRRGCQIPLTNESPQDYADAAKWPHGDLARALREVQARAGQAAPLIGVGFSLGANYLTSHLGAAGPQSPLVAGVALGNPFDLVGSSYWVKHVNRVIGATIRDAKRRLVRRHRASIEARSDASVEAASKRVRIDVDALLGAESYRDQASLWNLRCWGRPTEGINAYLERSSSEKWLSSVRRPLLLVSALDDPVSHCNFIPFAAIQSSTHAVLAVTARGGHHAYLDLVPTRLPWCDRVALDWLEGALAERRDAAARVVQRAVRRAGLRAPRCDASRCKASARRATDTASSCGVGLEDVRPCVRDGHDARGNGNILNNAAAPSEDPRRRSGSRDDEAAGLSYVQLGTWKRTMAGRAVLLCVLWPAAGWRLRRAMQRTRLRSASPVVIGVVTALLTLWVERTWVRRRRGFS
jgi:predicted alpha/beta-fold hydrolase